MSLFSVSKDEFESFQSLIEDRLLKIETEIQQRPADAEQQARTAASNAIDFEKQARLHAEAIQSALDELNQHKTGALQELEALQAEKANAVDESERLNQQIHTEVAPPWRKNQTRNLQKYNQKMSIWRINSNYSKVYAFGIFMASIGTLNPIKHSHRPTWVLGPIRLTHG